ncbi:MAG: peptide ABC transporter substrate-binding protein [Anaerolineae bacterium]|nr:peptide ABC transporter substrate-binding protein [Anaerolineae bacterium]
MVTGGLGIVSAQADDTLNILFWQAASNVNPYLSGGTKELEAAALVLEPLARIDPDGVLTPFLAADIPTVANGGVSEDLTTITWTLQEGLLWSDGTPVTSADVVFTYEYCTNEETGCAQLTFFDGVASVEAMDDLTIVITFDGPKPYPYGPFVSFQSPIIQAAQFADCIGANAQNCTDQNFGPIGTGPYVVDEFLANDVVTYTVNENYRVEGQPYFSRVVFKGGGDAESAARAVLETGEADYAWNLQIAPDVLLEMESAGLGTVIVGFATNVERLMMNQTNPDPALGDARSVWAEDGSNGHPFLNDPVVYQAMSMAIDRNIIAEQLYGAGGIATCNVLPGPPAYASSNNDSCLTQDIDGANAMLDEAGIVDSDGDGIREYDGIPMSILYQTSTNAVRQNTQALIKQWWEEIGIEVELRNIDAAVFFGGDPASPDTYGKFYADIEMYTNGSSGPDPETYMAAWTCSSVSGPDNNWLGNNVPRYCNPEYDALVQAMSDTADLDERASLAIQMNDLLVQDGVMIPLIYRGSVSAHSNTVEGVQMNAWDAELWNVAEWVRSE